MRTKGGTKPAALFVEDLVRQAAGAYLARSEADFSARYGDLVETGLGGIAELTALAMDSEQPALVRLINASAAVEIAETNAAASELAAFRGPLSEFLAQYVRSQADPSERGLAMKVYARLEGSEGLRLLTEASKSADDEALRRLAVELVAAVPGKDAGLVLLSAAREAPSDEMFAAIASGIERKLAELPELAEAVADGLQDASSVERKLVLVRLLACVPVEKLTSAALDALQRRAWPAFQFLLELPLPSSTKAEIIQIAGAFRGDEAREFFLAALRSPGEGQWGSPARRPVRRSLGGGGSLGVGGMGDPASLAICRWGEEAVPELLSILKEGPSDLGRVLAARALVGILQAGEVSPVSAPSVQTALRDALHSVLAPGQDTILVHRALVVADLRGLPDLNDKLLALAGTSLADEAVRVHALRVLEKTGDAGTLAALGQLSRSEISARVRVWLKRSLLRLQHRLGA